MDPEQWSIAIAQQIAGMRKPRKLMLDV